MSGVSGVCGWGGGVCWLLSLEVSYCGREVVGGCCAGCWLVAAGYWLLVAGCWLLTVAAAGCLLFVAGCWLLAVGC